MDHILPPARPAGAGRGLADSLRSAGSSKTTTARPSTEGGELEPYAALWLGWEAAPAPLWDALA